jgi:hypothetical protein
MNVTDELVANCGADGDDSQATNQDVDTEIITSADNTCSESACSNTISISTGENSNDGSKQPPGN